MTLDIDAAATWRQRHLAALASGAVPLRVRGSLIGAVGVSGLPEEDDHRFVIDPLRVFGR